MKEIRMTITSSSMNEDNLFPTRGDCNECC